MRRNKNKKQWLWQCARGSISIILAAALLPFFSLAAVLVEGGRYQNSVKALDQAIGSSAYSTLAEYESYIYSRFGMLAVKQTENENLISDELSKYLSRQKTTDMKGVSLDSVTTQGVYPLSDTAVLKQQLLDYSTVLVPARIALEVADIDNLVSQLEKSLGISALSKQLSSGSKLISSEVDVFSSLEEARDSMDALKKTIQTYEDKYTAFADAVNALAAHLATERPDPAQDEAGAKSWDDTAASLRTAADSAASAYASSVQSVINDLQTLHDGLGDVVQKADAMVAQVDVFVADSSSALAQADADVADKDAAATYKNIIAANNALGTGAQAVNGSVRDAVETLSESSFVSAISDLQKEKNAAEAFTAASVTETTALDAAVYHFTDLSGFTDSDALDSLLDEMEDEAQDDAGLSSLFALFDIVTSLFHTELFFDGRLNSTLDVDYYNSTYGGLPSAKAAPDDPDFLAQDEDLAKKHLAQMDPDYDESDPFGYESTGMAKMERFLNTMEEFVDSLADIKDAKKVKDKLKACGKALSSGADLFDQMSNLGAIVGQVLNNFAAREVVMGYLAYNLPNRTNFQTGSTLTGYSYGNAALAYERTGSNVPLVGEVLGLGSTYINYAFVGAELEYIIGGSKSEIANQSKVFMFLWGTRILLDLIPVLSNAELQTIFGSLNAIPVLGTAVAVIAEVVVILAEPLIDTYVLVNGSEVPLIKSKIYLSPSGIPSLIETMTTLALSQTTKNKITNKAQKWTGVDETAPKPIEADKDKPLVDGDKWKEDVFSLNYTEHLLLLMTLFGNQETYLKRLGDLIQTEMTQRNLVNNTTIQQDVTGEYYDFDLDEAYTAVRVQATGSVVQVLPIPSLSTSSMLRFDRIIYRGY